ncbi:hypothetical protein HYS31_02150 [Candidatus Woesearchaeota archaeon]|nr:hypothetical protein [Candidatus Woesearchaeota archaeon]
MSSFLEKTKEVIAKNQDVLAVFEELDRTGKFRKRTYKIKAQELLQTKRNKHVRKDRNLYERRTEKSSILIDKNQKI